MRPRQGRPRACSHHRARLVLNRETHNARRLLSNRLSRVLGVCPVVGGMYSSWAKEKSTERDSDTVHTPPSPALSRCSPSCTTTDKSPTVL